MLADPSALGEHLAMMAKRKSASRRFSLRLQRVHKIHIDVHDREVDHHLLSLTISIMTLDPALKSVTYAA